MKLTGLAGPLQQAVRAPAKESLRALEGACWE